MERLPQQPQQSPQPPHPEQERNPDEKFSIPLTDILKDADRATELWPDYASELAPQIEQRQAIAASVNHYVDHFYDDIPSPEAHHDYLNAVSELLADPDYERIALFLPFESFPQPSDQSESAAIFRANYLSAWQNLLFSQDVRATFTDGDIYEPDARQSDPERVVKAAHLAPFLVQAQFLQTSDILDIMEFEENDLLSWSFLDTLPLMRDLGQISPTDAARFAEIQHNLPERPVTQPPKYISKQRQRWLDEQASAEPRPTDFTSAMTSLGEPLSSRIDQLQDEIRLAKELAATLDSEQDTGVVILGGSRLKGYGRPDSDTDLHTFTKTTQPHQTAETSDYPIPTIPLADIRNNPSAYAHEVFNTIWTGGSEKVRHLQRNLAPLFFQETDMQTRKWNTERLEQDLLEYRLLQKGYARLCPDTNPEYKKYTQMDGQSAFYETGFRVIATKIYANSIFIPKINPR